MLARVVPSDKFWRTVDELERLGMSRAAAREIAERAEPPRVPDDDPIRRLLAWTGPRKDTP